MSEGNELAAVLAESLSLEGYHYLALTLLAAAASYVAVRFYLIGLIYRAMERSKTEWDDILASKGVFRQFAYLAPAIVLYFGVAFYPLITDIARQFILAYIAIIVVFIVDRSLSGGLEIYRLYPVSQKRPIKAYVQFAKLIIYILGTVTVVALLLGKSPLGVLGGIGAMTAVLIVVFRNTIISLIAGIQLVANDLIHIDDWIEMPECGVDGHVTEIALHTIKVQNFDKTIVTVPTYKLMDDSFKNWRGMRETGGRRIKRSILIDQTSVHFCNDELLEKFSRVHRLKPYLEAKQNELEQANIGLEGAAADQPLLNRRVLTNLGTFRAYALAYIKESAKISGDLTVMVRQLHPTPDGLPLEIYAFSTETSLISYEGVQADIFDHLLAAMQFFDLRVFQHPTGRDLQAITR